MRLEIFRRALDAHRVASRRRAHFLVLPLALFLGQAPAAAAAGGSTEVELAVQHALTHAKIRAALLERLGADALGIDIDLTGTHVQLKGQVDKRSSQTLAKDVALSVAGVTDVDDQLTVRPEGERSAGKHLEADIKDALLVSRVKGRLLSEIGRNALKIDVDATDGVVSLRGVVANRELKKLAVDRARSTRGVRKVVSLLTTA